MKLRTAELALFWASANSLRVIMKNKEPLEAARPDLDQLEAIGLHSDQRLLRNLSWALIAECNRVYTRELVEAGCGSSA